MNLISALLISILAFTNVFAQDFENKTALVIGNTNYEEGKLRNPVNDARDLSETLAGLGFNVITKFDLDRAAMRSAVREFGDLVKDKNGIALFYYSGHGLQSNGINYLVPLGADIHEEWEIPDQCVSADHVLRMLNTYENPFNIIILDACRNNPYKSRYRSTANGLAHPGVLPDGSIMAYSTAPGRLADDGIGSNGLYTQELIKAIETPGLDIESVFKQTRINVKKLSGDKQIPWETTSLVGDFYFTRQPASQTVLSNTSELTGSINFKSYVGGKLFVDKEFITDVSPATSFSLDRISIGEHQAEIRTEDGNWEFYITIEEGKVQSFDIDPPILRWKWDEQGISKNWPVELNTGKGIRPELFICLSQNGASLSMYVNGTYSEPGKVTYYDYLPEWEKEYARKNSLYVAWSDAYKSGINDVTIEAYSKSGFKTTLDGTFYVEPVSKEDLVNRLTRYRHSVFTSNVDTIQGLNAPLRLRTVNLSLELIKKLMSADYQDPSYPFEPEYGIVQWRQLFPSLYYKVRKEFGQNEPGADFIWVKGGVTEGTSKFIAITFDQHRNLARKHRLSDSPEDLMNFLKRQYNYQLINWNNPTKEELVSKIKDLQNTTYKNNDQLIIYFHAIPNDGASLTNELFWDMSSYDEELIGLIAQTRGTEIFWTVPDHSTLNPTLSSTLLLNLIADIPCRSILLIFDVIPFDE